MMRGIASPEEICQNVKELGMDTIALTDTNGIYGLQWFLEEAKALQIKPIIGAELKTEKQRAIIVVKNNKGYRQLCKCLTARHNDEKFNISGYLSKQDLNNLIIITDDKLILQTLKGKPDVYVELQANNPHYSLLNLSKELNIRPVATSCVMFLNKEDYNAHRLLRAVDLNTTIDRVSEHELACKNALLLSPSEMEKAFSHCPDALGNTVKIAEMCRTNWDFSDIIFPQFHNNEKAFEILTRKCEQGAVNRYGKITNKVRTRLDYELNIIKKMGYSHYFLTVEDIIENIITLIPCKININVRRIFPAEIQKSFKKQIMLYGIDMRYK